MLLKYYLPGVVLKVDDWEADDATLWSDDAEGRLPRDGVATPENCEVCVELPGIWPLVAMLCLPAISDQTFRNVESSTGTARSIPFSSFSFIISVDVVNDCRDPGLNIWGRNGRDTILEFKIRWMFKCPMIYKLLKYANIKMHFT